MPKTKSAFHPLHYSRRTRLGPTESNQEAVYFRTDSVLIQFFLLIATDQPPEEVS